MTDEGTIRIQDPSIDRAALKRLAMSDSTSTDIQEIVLELGDRSMVCIRSADGTSLEVTDTPRSQCNGAKSD